MTPAITAMPASPPSHNLSVELVQNIFETTAKRYRTCIVTLMLVSKQIQAWVEPFMYETVILRPNQLQRDVFLSTIMSINPKFESYLSRTKHLYLGHHFSLGDTKDILSRFSTLDSLSFWIRSGDQFSILVENLRLQHVSMTIPYYQNGMSTIWTIECPMSSNLTHLEIIYGPDRDACRNLPEMRQLHRLTHLTHLAVPSHWLGKWVKTTLECCKELEVLLLRGSMDEARPLVRYGIYDCRVVTMNYSICPQSWEASLGSDNGIWSEAEEIISKRLKGEGGASWTAAEKIHLHGPGFRTHND